MALTRLSLLFRMRDLTHNQSWDEFVQTYAPVISQTARRCGLRDTDIDDIQQEVLVQMMRTIQRFHKDDAKGRFRHYLARITVNKIQDFYRKSKYQMHQIEFPCLIPAPNETEEIWEEELNRHVFRLAVQRVRQHSQPATWKCFEEHVLQKRQAAVVSDELGITENAVFINCSRTLARIRATANQLKRDFNETDRTVS